MGNNDRSVHKRIPAPPGPDCRKVGIMADSHGQPQTIADALEFLGQRGCERIYHLGDICDSFLPETSGSCVGLLREADVSAVKGNNDHAIVINHEGQRETPVSDMALAYLRDLPAVVEYDGAVFTHSLPFVKQLGLSSMIGVMAEGWARRFFDQYPGGILFRGHGHTPKIRWLRNGELSLEEIDTDRIIGLANRMPCVVTCGALTEGLCMVWDAGKQTLTSLSFGNPIL